MSCKNSQNNTDLVQTTVKLLKEFDHYIEDNCGRLVDYKKITEIQKNIYLLSTTQQTYNKEFEKARNTTLNLLNKKKKTFEDNIQKDLDIIILSLCEPDHFYKENLLNQGLRFLKKIIVQSFNVHDVQNLEAFISCFQQIRMIYPLCAQSHQQKLLELNELKKKYLFLLNEGLLTNLSSQHHAFLLFFINGEIFKTSSYEKEFPILTSHHECIITPSSLSSSVMMSHLINKTPHNFVENPSSNKQISSIIKEQIQNHNKLQKSCPLYGESQEESQLLLEYSQNLLSTHYDSFSGRFLGFIPMFMHQIRAFLSIDLSKIPSITIFNYINLQGFFPEILPEKSFSLNYLFSISTPIPFKTQSDYLKTISFKIKEFFLDSQNRI